LGYKLFEYIFCNPMLDECLYQELLTDVVDIILHCVDHNHLKQRPLHEVFPPVQTFHQVMNSEYVMGYVKSRRLIRIPGG
jgi:hypothetical protein